MSEIYRGYTIDTVPLDPKPAHTLATHEYVIKKAGAVVCSQPSLAFAYAWVDQEVRRQRAGSP